MLARIVGAAFGAKATVVPAAVVLAATLVAGSAQSNDVPERADDPAPVFEAILALPAVPTPARTSQAPRPSAPAAVAASAAPTACAPDQQVRAAALRSIRDAYASADAALDALAAERTGTRATEALDRAGAMLDRIDRAAEDLASAPGACAADVREVSGRAAHAMEMIVDLARSATAPTPTPTPRATPRPKETRKHH